MGNKIRFLIICIFVSAFCIASVCASDNVTADEVGSANVMKETPKISINASDVYTGKSIGFYLKDSNDAPIAGENLTARFNKGMDHVVKTDDDGAASLKLNLKPNSYVLDLSFDGNDRYSPVSKTFNIKVLKLSSKITPVNTTVLKNKYLYVDLKDNFGNAVTGKTVSFKIDGKTYKATTNSNGRAGVKITLTPNAKYSVKISYSGNNYYNSVSKTISLIVPATTSIIVGNTKLLTNGYLRVYLISSTLSAISKKTVTISIGNATFTKTTNDEGVVIFKPYMGANNYTITASFAGSSTIFSCSDSKEVSCIKGNVKDPLKEKIPLVNGVPDIDVMKGNYIMANGNMKYTLLKAQYLETIRRDSYYLYLYNKLPKYVYFKTKYGSNLQHILVREKWNVIERAVNTKIVKANKHNYWPGSVTVSLSGKSYTYSPVRDVQNTGYTCGPTSSSMCTQVLKSYVSEKQLAKLAKTTASDGTRCKLLKAGLEKLNFKCSYYYKASFTKAINQLKKGGCALVFHTWNHYVAILDISKDGKKVLVGNPSGDYDHGSHSIPTNWLTVNYMKKMFNNYDTSGLIVKLKYNLKSSTKTQLKNTYSSFGAGWTAQNTNERIPQI